MFQRQPLREDVQKEILNRIVDGRLAAGSRINETHLAADMGLSRTPLREAMITLGARQHLISHMGRGFAVPPLDAAFFKEIQAILSRLEPFALSEASAMSPQTVMELNNLINRVRMKLGRDPAWPQHSEALTVLVHQWSFLVMQHGRNQTLQIEIARLQGLAGRFWYHLARHGFPCDELLASYGKLYDLLRSGHTQQAGTHWQDQTVRFSESAFEILTASHDV
jgi:DNA-binding GntR family transcriptional regulator